VTPEIGITSTPVIDRTRNAIYVVAVVKTSAGAYVHRIHALNLATGAELFGGPTTVTATYPGTGANSTNGTDTFDPKQYNERPALLQVGATIYTTWGSHCDDGPYNSWDVVQRGHLEANERAEPCAERRGWRNLDGGCGSGGRCERKYLLHHRQRRFRHDADFGGAAVAR
jgi:hypothetical protein